MVDDISPAPRPDVFVSYARGDELRARQLIAILEKDGFSVWWDGKLEAGAEYSNKIQEALETAKAVVVLWSNTSLASNWVRDEAEAGRDRSTLVPVSLDGCLPPLGFRQLQAVDMSQWKGKATAPAVKEVLAAVRHLAERDDAEGVPASPAFLARSAVQTPGGIRTRLFGLIAAATLVSAGAWAWLGAGDDPEVNSLAILPFENLSGDENQDYFSTGLGEEVRQVLSQSAEMRIAAQSSTQTAADEDKSPLEIAEHLGVRYLLDGSVRRDGNMVRVSVSLINGADGFDIWSQSYDRDLDDIFAVQLEIAEQVAQALKVQIVADGDGTASRIGGTTNTAAFDAYLRGKSLYELALNEETDRNAASQLKSAVAADPKYGAAWAALSTVQTTLANSYASDRPRSELYGEAIASARKAIEVAPQLAEGHAALGYVLLNGSLDAKAASGPYRQAYALGQNDSGVLQSYASYTLRTGDTEQALQAIDRAIALDPLSAILFRVKAQILAIRGDYDGARKAIRKTFELNPDISVAYRVLGNIAYLEGDYRKALAAFQKEGNALSRLPGLAVSHAKLGNDVEAAAAMAELQAEYGDNGLYQQAQVLAQTGETRRALDMLERAFAVGDSGLVLARGDPMLKPLRGEARFKALLKRMGFTAPPSE